ncbi:TPA: fluoride efflux transporter CrcB [Pasteurella multocida]|nr:fluoride efflux transporter CrcB [Pasteurella multocida]HDR1331591.1 fluoride efflux transporter CrcB [Pasteurella multocida]HDR1437408.1 fluoride efflux transporter CrcB [Pasteurella multocida]HDR1481240.1 fluoride efflux transporter CrcB [Pasteurella multocida]HDR1482954.1 fluoride efflux transporter CrcB [Pasteurella multocida]
MISVGQQIIFISSGAALGALSRWGLGLLLNPLFSAFSLGTLVANYLGCLIIGVFLAFFWQYPQCSAEWRLFFVTGFLGSLTTFSTFSAEVIENLIQQKWLAGLMLASGHLLGCLLFTALGMFIWRYWQ